MEHLNQEDATDLDDLSTLPKPQPQPQPLTESLDTQLIA
jgi:hypothetical protein